MRRSLRFQLLVGTAAASAIVLGMLGAGVYFSMERSLRRDFEQTLIAKAQALSTTIERDGDKVQMEYDPAQMPEFAAKNHPDYFQAWSGGGVLARSPSLGSADLPAFDGTDDSHKAIKLHDGQDGFAMGITVLPRQEQDDEGAKHADDRPTPVFLTVATQTTSLDQTLQTLRWLLGGFCGLAVIVSGVSLMAIVRAGLRPLVKLAGDIEHLGDSDLAVRLPALDIPIELRPVVDKLNGLLGRLEAAFVREKSFTADVAHELRTPLAGLRTTLEVTASRPRNAEEYSAAIASCSGMIERMQAMVENLLLLARTESDQLPVSRSCFDVGELLDQCTKEIKSRAIARNLKIEWKPGEPIIVNSDRARLRLVFDNIMDNAVHYTDSCGTVRISLYQLDGRLRLEIANSGCLLEPADFAHVFERFWRGESARSEAGIHCGLGLSICRRLIYRLGGSMIAEPGPDRWFILRMELPQLD